MLCHRAHLCAACVSAAPSSDQACCIDKAEDTHWQAVPDRDAALRLNTSALHG